MHVFVHQFSQILTTLDLERNQIDAQGAEHLANALQQNKVRLLTPFDFLCIYSFIIFHRHSQHWTLGQPNWYSRRRTSCERVAAEHGEVAHTTRLPMHVFVHQFSQTLITLNLWGNQIGTQGAKHLANALQQNKVRLLTPLDFLCIYSFIIFHRRLQH
jgi:hypothetical protein